MLDPREVLQTIDRLQSTFEDLAVRGLRSCGEQLNTLSSLHEELDRIGAAHLAGRLEVLIAAIKSDDRSSPSALMRAQASLRCFDRILTLESVSAQLGCLVSEADESASDNGDDSASKGDDEDEDEEEDDEEEE